MVISYWLLVLQGSFTFFQYFHLGPGSHFGDGSALQQHGGDDNDEGNIEDLGRARYLLDDSHQSEHDRRRAPQPHPGV